MTRIECVKVDARLSPVRSLLHKVVPRSAMHLWKLKTTSFCALTNERNRTGYVHTSYITGLPKTNFGFDARSLRISHSALGEWTDVTLSHTHSLSHTYTYTHTPSLPQTYRSQWTFNNAHYTMRYHINT